MTSSEKIKAAEEQITFADSREQPAWHVIVLSVFTFGAYNMYWLYRNLRTLRDQAEALQNQVALSKDNAAQIEPDLKQLARLEAAGTLPAYLAFAQVRPVLTTALFAVPFVNLLVLLGFANAAAALWPERKSFIRHNSKLTAFLIALLFGTLTLLVRLPEPYWLFYLSSSVPLFIVQTWINRHWKLVYGDEKHLARQAFSPLELVAIVAGASLLGLLVVHPDLKAFH